jgi:hypothetical protein
MLDYSIELINEQTGLGRLINHLASTSVIALDIETVNWWNRHQERVALIQLAFRTERKSKVVIIDTLAKLDLEPLRLPLELGTTIKVIHNAVFDATRLVSHFKFNVTPVYDTMLAARRNGERRYSLAAQGQTHLNLHLDKGGQRSDWSRRPLDTKQIHYAALDAFSTLLLYENQINRGLSGDFQLKSATSSSQQVLPLTDLPEPRILPTPEVAEFIAGNAETEGSAVKPNLPASAIALLGIITKLPSRYHPDQLAVSVGSERVGLAGWTVDQILGTDADFDEATAKLGIANLCDRRLVRITTTQRLETTEKGARLWQFASENYDLR